MAPEYAMRGYLTEKADVYSFGVVALETVSGKSNSNVKPSDNLECLLDRVNIYISLPSLKTVIQLNNKPEETLVSFFFFCTCRPMFCKTGDAY